MEPIYVKIDENLKKRTKKQAIDLGIDYRDFVTLALDHYAEHIDKNDIDLDAHMV